jgi:hypothetical protein
MSTFDSKSRYVRHAKIAQATDRRGRIVSCLTPAVIPEQAELGRHRLRQGQRLDHLANHYLDNPNGYWRIAEINDAMTVESALDTSLIRIPVKG